mmetsp:Transcript_10427/g.17917  ORF Transcript_10427/g.17917 Transcript_10427/m.17917 type:complete len:322 (+) Transcript_10427:1400-2365(+)
MAGDEWDPDLEALGLHLFHGVQGGPGGIDGAHVVVGPLLPAGGVLAHHGAPGQLQIHALEVGLAGDEEQLLLEADVVHQPVDLHAARREHARAGLRQRLHGAVQRRLLVERVALPRHEARRHEEGVAAQEDRRHRIDGKVRGRCVSGTHAAVGVGGAISLALQQLLAREVEAWLAIGVEGEERVLHHSGLSVAVGGSHRLEPMAPRGRAMVQSPLADGLGNLVCLGNILHPGVILHIGNSHAHSLEVFVRNSTFENILTDAVQRCRLGGLHVLAEHGLIHGQVHVAREGGVHLQRLAPLDHSALRHGHASAHEGNICLNRC